MSFVNLAKRVRACASAQGITAPMSRLNDAIAGAFFAKKYSAAVAADRAGTLGRAPVPPPFISTAAREYDLPEHAFGKALRDGMFGPPQKGGSVAEVVASAMPWLYEEFRPQIQELEDRELYSLATDDLLETVMAMPSYAISALEVFGQHVISECELLDKGVSRTVADILLTSKNRIPWDRRQKDIIRNLSASRLHAYVVETVHAGFGMVLRPFIDGQGSYVYVDERSGSDPAIVGKVIAARVIPEDSSFVMSGASLTFTHFGRRELDRVLNEASDTKTNCRTIRSIWFTQFAAPEPSVVLAGTGDPLSLITDTYRVDSMANLEAALDSASDVDGTKEQGWSRVYTDGAGMTRQACGITVVDGMHLEMFHMTERHAVENRQWFDALTRGCTSYLHTKVEGPMEAAMSVDDAARRRPKELDRNQYAQIIEQFMRQHYSSLVTQAIPSLGGSTPRNMLGQPGGEKRVRDWLQILIDNERSLAQQDGRAPIDFHFMFDLLGLSVTHTAPASRAPAITSSMYPPGEAWLVFAVTNEPIRTDNGNAMLFGTMDVGSAKVLNVLPILDDRPVDESIAMELLTPHKWTPPKPHPTLLLIETSIEPAALRTIASSAGIQCVEVEPEITSAITRKLRETLASRLDSM